MNMVTLLNVEQENGFTVASVPKIDPGQCLCSGGGDRPGINHMIAERFVA
jgi:hypothetical protein